MHDVIEIIKSVVKHIYLVIFSIGLLSLVVNQILSLVETSTISCFKHKLIIIMNTTLLVQSELVNNASAMLYLFFPRVWRIWGCCTCYTLIFVPSLHFHICIVNIKSEIYFTCYTQYNVLLKITITGNATKYTNMSNHAPL